MGNQKRIEEERKPRVLCLYGFRTSCEIIKKKVTTNWPESVIKKLDLVYECLEYIQDIMLKQVLTNVPKIKFLIIIGGEMFRSPIAENAYIPSSPVQSPSLHFSGIFFGLFEIEICYVPLVFSNFDDLAKAQLGR
ncbi:hypothetical protein MKX03_003833, partial [Papaver bracteatum]